jgi:hypothetical protein
MSDTITRHGFDQGLEDENQNEEAIKQECHTRFCECCELEDVQWFAGLYKGRAVIQQKTKVIYDPDLLRQ